MDADELNPAHVTEQRRVLGKRGIKTDQIDLAAMFDLLVVGRGLVVAARCDALAQHTRHRPLDSTYGQLDLHARP